MKELKHTSTGKRMMKSPSLQSLGLKITFFSIKIVTLVFRTDFSLNRHKNSPNRVTIQVNRVPILFYQAHGPQMYGPNRDTKINANVSRYNVECTTSLPVKSCPYSFQS